MTKWDKTFHGISICYKEQIVQIKTDKALLDYLSGPENGSIELSEQILARYKELFQKELKVSEASMSVEILIHAYMDVFARNVEKLVKMLPEAIGKGLIMCLKKMEASTEIIDSGEKEVDSNRFVFDGLVPYRKVLYAILREKA
ncbi:MAG: hypothetical protein IJN92_00420 [Lachnospiraceae bacterium]|nr:hypothetical protein [Lachnospiraceae bacterium]